MKIFNLKIQFSQIAFSWRKCLVLCAFLWFSIGHSQTEPKINSVVDTTSIKIGEQINFTVTVETDTLAQVIFPDGQTFSPLETVEAFETDTTRKADRMTLQKIYALTQFDSGSYKLPAQRIEVNGKGYFTDSTQVNVADVAVDTLAQKMYDIKPLREVEKSHSKFWKWLLGILLAIALIGGLAYWFFIRKKPLTEEEKVALLPPYDRALLELKNLENSKYLIQDEYKEYYSELTNIVRSYLEEDVHVTALESTTDELIAKLEMLRDAGELKIDDDTLQQFKRILQTADLVKFAKSKPETSVAKNDRKAIEEIVIKTHEALPEPTEEELMEQAEFQEELARKKQKKKWVMAGVAALALIVISIASSIAYYGFDYVKDTALGHPTKKLLEGEWVASTYGYPPINLETPEVLKRQDVKLTPEMKGNIQDLQIFMYRDSDALFTVGTTSTTLTQEAEPDFEQSIEMFIKNLEEKGAKNIITKQEEFTTVSGVKGIKVYGSGQFAVPESDDLVRGKYSVILFGGKGFQQQVILTWLDDDQYAEEIVERIQRTLEVKTDV
ncbi:BatD family protein [Pseudozobellia sp. WGM2]|uniref:BatD family protein n=1 Tax=Pseudozobellia sp. WGM2 TaxID=2787625 RepID=UPI001FD7A436|nr:BatD family protein [Pseudozobellia sp. WGM2]